MYSKDEFERKLVWAVDHIEQLEDEKKAFANGINARIKDYSKVIHIIKECLKFNNGFALDDEGEAIKKLIEKLRPTKPNENQIKALFTKADYMSDKISQGYFVIGRLGSSYIASFAGMNPASLETNNLLTEASEVTATSDTLDVAISDAIEKAKFLGAKKSGSRNISAVQA